MTSHRARTPVPRDPGSRARRVVTVAGTTAMLAIAVVACGGSATPSPSAGRSVEPPASPSPDASPSIVASPSASPSSSAAASSGVIGTTGTVEIAGEGFRITLPDGWQAIPLDQSSIDRIADLFPADSQIGQLLQSQAGSLALAGVKLFAVDPRPASVAQGTAPNLNVIVQPKPPGLTVQLLGTLAKAQLEAMESFSGVTIDTVTLPAGPAVKASYAVEQSASGGTAVHAVGQQYYLASDVSLFIVTMTGGSDALAGTFDAMAQSIEID